MTAHYRARPGAGQGRAYAAPAGAVILRGNPKPDSPAAMRLCWPRLITLLLVAVLGTASMLSACGQKGDLYLPDPARKAEDKPKG